MNNTHFVKINGFSRLLKIMSYITFCLVIIMGALTLTSCGSKKKAITGKEFKSILGSDFEYTDLTSQYKSSDASIVEVLDAKRDDGLELQYWRMKDDINASVNFHYKRHRIENQCPSNNSWDKENNEVMVAEGSNSTVYYKASKVDDTVVYTTVTLDNQKAVEKLFEKLGY